MTRCCALLVSVMAWTTFAQAGASPKAEPSGKAEDRRAPTYKELERGFFFEARGGFNAVINPPARAGGKTYFSTGQAVGIDVGFDIGERVSPALFFLASANRMGSDYRGLSNDGTSSGDFSALIPGAAVKVRIVGFADTQEVQRTWIYARAAGGVTFFSPQSLLPNIDVFLSAGPGLEYYTRLRHLVIGVEANFTMMALTQSVGFSTLLTVKYAFPFD